MADDRPFYSAYDKGLVFTTKQVMSGDLPLLLVTHNADDGAWQFVNGAETGDTKSGLFVHAEHIVDLDPSVLDLLNLPLGWIAWRGSQGEPWIRRPRPPEWDQD